MPSPVELDRKFFALSDATRRGMIDHLMRGPASVSELANPFDIAMPTAMKHLAVLEDSGFVASEKNGRVRTYQLTPKAFTSMEQWVAARSANLNAQFDRLANFLDASMKKDK